MGKFLKTKVHKDRDATSANRLEKKINSNAYFRLKLTFKAFQKEIGQKNEFAPLFQAKHGEA